MISRTFPIANTQGTIGDQFPFEPRCHLPSNSLREMLWRVKDHQSSYLRINEMFPPNLCHIKWRLTDLNSGNTPKSPISWWKSGKHSPKLAGNRLAGERGKGKMSIKGGMFKKEMFNIDTCNVTFPISYFYASTTHVMYPSVCLL